MSEVIARVVAIDNEQIIGELVAELVRCRDCKHWWYGNYCDKHGKGQENADWFCTDGEKAVK